GCVCSSAHSLVTSYSSSTYFMLALFFLILLLPPSSTLFPYTTLFRSCSSAPSSMIRPLPWKTAYVCGLLRSCTETITRGSRRMRSEEHTSELQSRVDLVCRLLLEKKKKRTRY